MTYFIKYTLRDGWTIWETTEDCCKERLVTQSDNAFTRSGDWTPYNWDSTRMYVIDILTPSEYEEVVFIDAI